MLRADISGAPLVFQITSENTVTLGANNNVGVQFGLEIDELFIPETIEYEDKRYTIIELAPFALSKTKFTKIILPSTIKKIGSHGFFMADVSEVDLSKTKIISIPQYCFASSSIKTILLPKTLKSVGKCSFYSTLIKTIDVPRNLSVIAARAFDLSLIEEIDLSETKVTSIGHYAFAASMLKKFIPPYCLESLGAYALSTTPLLTITLPNSLLLISENCFYNCIMLKLVDLSETKLTIIPAFCFYGCRSLKSCILPETIESVESFSFYNSSIPKITFSPIFSSIARCAFMASDIEEVDLTKTAITSIESLAFAQCNHLLYFDFSRGLKSINEVAFANCSIERVILPATITELGIGAYYRCAVLRYVDLSKTMLTEIPSQCFQNCYLLDTIIFNNYIHTLGNASFSSIGITKLKLFGNISTLEEFCFAMNEQLTEVDLSNTKIKHIYLCAFRQCSHLSNIILPVSLRSLGNAVFMGTNLTSFVAHKHITQLGNQLFMSSMMEVADLSSSNIENLPSQFFFNCSFLRKVTLPLNLKFISPSCFFNTSITKLNVPDSLTAIAPTAFANCVNLTVLDLSKTKLHEIGRQAFVKCYNFVDLVLPPTIKFIGSAAFALTGIENLTIPSGVDFIAQDAFKGMYNLKYLDLSNVDLENVQNKKTFEDLVELETLLLPPMLLYVHKHAFDRCTELKVIYYNGTNDLSAKCSFKKRVPYIIVTTAYPTNKIFGQIPVFELPNETETIEEDTIETEKHSTISSDSDNQIQPENDEIKHQETYEDPTIKTKTKVEFEEHQQIRQKQSYKQTRRITKKYSKRRGKESSHNQNEEEQD